VTDPTTDVVEGRSPTPPTPTLTATSETWRPGAGDGVTRTMGTEHEE
jgi:hypothetical protein